MPASIVLDRWFTDHRGLAVGICAAGTGVCEFADAFVEAMKEAYPGLPGESGLPELAAALYARK